MQGNNGGCRGEACLALSPVRAMQRVANPTRARHASPLLSASPLFATPDSKYLLTNGSCSANMSTYTPARSCIRKAFMNALEHERLPVSSLFTRTVREAEVFVIELGSKAFASGRKLMTQNKLGISTSLILLIALVFAGAFLLMRNTPDNAPLR